MYLVGISGSPRKNGDSAKIIQMAVDYFAEYGLEMKTVKLCEVEISPCAHCDGCKKSLRCTRDPHADAINTLLANSAGIIVASPVYFGGMTGQLKCLVDKTRPLRNNFQLKGKIGAAVACAGDRNGGQENTIRDIHAWMLIQGMVVVGANRHFGGTVCDLDNDPYGQLTVRDTLETVRETLEKITKTL